MVRNTWYPYIEVHDDWMVFRYHALPSQDQNSAAANTLQESHILLSNCQRSTQERDGSDGGNRFGPRSLWFQPFREATFEMKWTSKLSSWSCHHFFTKKTFQQEPNPSLQRHPRLSLDPCLKILTFKEAPKFLKVTSLPLDLVSVLDLDFCFFFLGFSSSSGSSLTSSIKKMMLFSFCTVTGFPAASLWWVKRRFTFREVILLADPFFKFKLILTYSNSI